MLLELAHEERFIARKASDGEPYSVVAFLRMTAKSERRRNGDDRQRRADCCHGESESFDQLRGLLDENLWNYRHSEAEVVVAILARLEDDFYRDALHYLHVITGGVFRREQA